MAYQPSRIRANRLCGTEETLHNINIGNTLLNTFKSKPDFIGQVDALTGERITFQQMRENSVKCALWLKKEGFGSGDKIIICTRNQMTAYIPLLASIYIGAIIVPWDRNYFLINNIRPLFFMIIHEPKVIFIDEDIISYLKSTLEFLSQFKLKISITPKIVVFGKFGNFYSLDLILNDNFNMVEIDKFSCVNMDPLATAVLMFNSNATTYENAETCICYFAFTYPSNQEVPVMSFGDIGLWYGSLCWTHSVLLTFRSIVSYVTAIKPFYFTEIGLYETIEKYKVTWVFLDSYMCNQLLQTDVIFTIFDLSSLKEFVFGNLAIKRNIHEKLIKSLPNVSIVQEYNSFPAHITCAYQRNGKKIGSSGYVAKNIQMEFIDLQTKDAVGPYVNGEIWYGLLFKSCDFDGNGCMFPNCTNNKKKRNNLKHKQEFISWYNSRDFGYYDENGNIFIIDKTIHLIKYKNFLVSSRKIENLLQSHPAVFDVVVIPVPHVVDGQRPRAYVKKNFEIKVTKEELIEYVAKNLPDCYKLRGGLFFKEIMPYLPNGKIDRALVQQDNIITDHKLFLGLQKLSRHEK